MKHLSKIFCLFILSALASFSYGQKTYTLEFNPQNYVVQTLSLEDKTFKVRAYENIVYVTNPVDTVYQKLNVYIPEEYFEGKSINGYTTTTAPIFFPNKIGGYMPATPATALSVSKKDGGFGGGNNKAVLFALAKGYVVASAGARGRTTKQNNGTFTGKAPAGIVDLKAAIRYLKHNDKNMPGDANKIISNGTSAGGAMSSLLGATGNNKDYEPYLKAIGAANATDDIFAVSAYCPITNLDHADMAYEWQFNGVNNYKSRNRTSDSLSQTQINISSTLKKDFPEYINKLQLKDKNKQVLTLDNNGNGSFKEFVKSYVMASAQKALNAGTNLSSLSWLKITNNKVTQLDFDAYVRYMERQKTPPAFDNLDLSAPENQVFGDSSIDKKHFTDFGTKNSTVQGKKADELVVKMMNPMYYIGDSKTKTAKNWRLRHGTKDKDTGLAISVILGTYLENKGYNVNLELPWDKPHSGDYDLNELFEWTDSICK